MRSSKKRSTRKTASTTRRVQHTAFFPLLLVSFVFWFVYRGMLRLPVLFDELIAKAIFFGLPVWLYVVMSGFRDIGDTFAPSKMRRGLMMGIAVGGVYGFAASLIAVFLKGSVSPSFAYLADGFWWEFFAALLTGFWETLFFFSFVMMVIGRIFKHWSVLAQIMLVMAIFVVFHLPNIFIRFEGSAVASQVALLALFSVGQALLFLREKNGYSLALSHAFWGMVLLLQF